MNTDLDEFCRIIYDAVDDPGLFETAIVSATRSLRVARCHLFLLGEENKSSGLNFIANINPEFLEEYHNNFAEIDYRVEKISSKSVEKAIFDHDINTEDGLKRSPIHNELFPKHKIYDLMGSNLSIEGNLGWFGVSTLRKNQAFSQDQRVMFEKMTPHARRALRLRQLRQDIHAQAQALQSANDTTTHGIILTSGNNIEFANRSSREIFDMGFLRMQDARLTCSDPEERQILQLGLNRAMAGRAPLVRLTDKRTSTVYAVQMFNPLPRFVEGRLEPARNMTYKIVPLLGPNPPSEQTVERLKQFFQLSESETQVISAALSMTSLGHYAKARSIQEDTARKQLKSAMRKIGIQSQKQLFQLHEQFKIFL